MKKKVCKGCGILKSIKEFHRHLGGCQRHCKSCRAIEAQIYKQKDKREWQSQKCLRLNKREHANIDKALKKLLPPIKLGFEYWTEANEVELVKTGG